jgi:hypothetical protein
MRREVAWGLAATGRADMAWGTVSLSHIQRGELHLRMGLATTLRMAREREYEKWASGEARYYPPFGVALRSVNAAVAC